MIIFNTIINSTAFLSILLCYDKMRQTVILQLYILNINIVDRIITTLVLLVVDYIFSDVDRDGKKYEAGQVWGSNLSELF